MLLELLGGVVAGSNLCRMWIQWGDIESSTTEPVFLNVYGAPELIPRSEFRQSM
jgi:hypothetical protein